MGKNVTGVGVKDLVAAGLKIREAEEFQRQLRAAVINGGLEPAEVWRSITVLKLLKPWHPHALHQVIYFSDGLDYDESIHGPPLYWFPSLHQSRRTNLGHLMESHGSRLSGALYTDPVSSFRQFQQFSVQHPEMYWSIILKELSIEHMSLKEMREQVTIQEFC